MTFKGESVKRGKGEKMTFKGEEVRRGKGEKMLRLSTCQLITL